MGLKTLFIIITISNDIFFCETHLFAEHAKLLIASHDVFAFHYRKRGKEETLSHENRKAHANLKRFFTMSMSQTED